MGGSRGSECHEIKLLLTKACQPLAHVGAAVPIFKTWGVVLDVPPPPPPAAALCCKARNLCILHRNVVDGALCCSLHCYLGICPSRWPLQIPHILSS